MRLLWSRVDEGWSASTPRRAACLSRSATGFAARPRHGASSATRSATSRAADRVDRSRAGDDRRRQSGKNGGTPVERRAGSLRDRRRRCGNDRERRSGRFTGHPTGAGSRRPKTTRAVPLSTRRRLERCGGRGRRNRARVSKVSRREHGRRAGPRGRRRFSGGTVERDRARRFGGDGPTWTRSRPVGSRPIGRGSHRADHSLRVRAGRHRPASRYGRTARGARANEVEIGPLRVAGHAARSAHATRAGSPVRGARGSRARGNDGVGARDRRASTHPEDVAPPIRVRSPSRRSGIGEAEPRRRRFAAWSGPLAKRRHLPPQDASCRTRAVARERELGRPWAVPLSRARPRPRPRRDRRGRQAARPGAGGRCRRAGRPGR